MKPRAKLASELAGYVMHADRQGCSKRPLAARKAERRRRNRIARAARRRNRG